MADTRRSQALELADETLRAFELSEVAPSAIARRAHRLARLLDDLDAETWLRFEIVGYPTLPDGLPPDAWEAATRSNRLVTRDEGARALTTSLGELEARIESGMAQLAASTDAPVSLSSANPNQYVSAPIGNLVERRSLRQSISADQALLDHVLGSIFEYVSMRHQELRFGSAFGSAFDVVRAEVDSLLGHLVPDAPRRLAAAFESATSDNPEHWAAAAATCRRLLASAADALRPPGPDVNKRKMGAEHYVNRLVDWIVTRGDSDTLAAMIVSDLEYLGRRLDAVSEAGNRGAHAEVSRYDASRYLTGTYLLLGDILRLAGPLEPERRPTTPGGPGEGVEAQADLEGHGDSQ